MGEGEGGEGLGDEESESLGTRLGGGEGGGSIHMVKCLLRLGD